VCKCVFLFLPTYYAKDHFEGAMIATLRTPWWQHLWFAETCWRAANVSCTYSVYVKLIIQINFHTIHGKYNIKICSGGLRKNHAFISLLKKNKKCSIILMQSTSQHSVEFCCISFAHFHCLHTMRNSQHTGTEVPLLCVIFFNFIPARSPFRLHSLSQRFVLTWEFPTLVTPARGMLIKTSRHSKMGWEGKE